MSQPLSVDVFERLHELLHLFRTRMRKAMEAVHPELSLNEMRILMRTGQQPGLTQKELVEHSHTDKAQMARILAQMEERGWLKRTASASDKRVRCLQLSARGQKLFSALRDLREQVATELLQHCPPPQQAQLRALLQQAGSSAAMDAAAHEAGSRQGSD